MKEGDGAEAGTLKTEAKLLRWLGEEAHPVVFVDMPGLNDPEGKDSAIIRDGCKFLSSAPKANTCDGGRFRKPALTCGNEFDETMARKEYTDQPVVEGVDLSFAAKASFAELCCK